MSGSGLSTMAGMRSMNSSIHSRANADSSRRCRSMTTMSAELSEIDERRYGKETATPTTRADDSFLTERNNASRRAGESVMIHTSTTIIVADVRQYGL